MELRVNPFADDLLARLKDARTATDLTQVELAAHLKVSPRTIQNWEAGKGAYPRASHRRRIAKFIESIEKDRAAAA